MMNKMQAKYSDLEKKIGKMTERKWDANKVINKIE